MPFLNRDGQVWAQLIMLSLVNLSGMVILMAIIFWQMGGNIMNERQQLIYTQVLTATDLADSIYAEYQQGEI